MSGNPAKVQTATRPSDFFGKNSCRKKKHGRHPSLIRRNRCTLIVVKKKKKKKEPRRPCDGSRCTRLAVCSNISLFCLHVNLLERWTPHAARSACPAECWGKQPELALSKKKKAAFAAGLCCGRAGERRKVRVLDEAPHHHGRGEEQSSLRLADELNWFLQVGVTQLDRPEAARGDGLITAGQGRTKYRTLACL